MTVTMNKSINYVSKSPDETKQIGKMLASGMQGKEVVCLFGDLGAGKTTFVNGFINYFQKFKRVPSPTFIIVRHYSVSHHLVNDIYHVDLYRLNKLKSIKELGILEILNKPKTIFLIEWPEKIDKLLIKSRINVKFKIPNETERQIEINE